jgi:hypothetical protein
VLRLAAPVLVTNATVRLECGANAILFPCRSGPRSSRLQRPALRCVLNKWR